MLQKASTKTAVCLFIRDAITAMKVSCNAFNFTLRNTIDRAVSKKFVNDTAKLYIIYCIVISPAVFIPQHCLQVLISYGSLDLFDGNRRNVASILQLFFLPSLSG